MMVNKWVALAAAFVLFSFGMILGESNAEDPVVETKYKVIEEVKIKEVPVEVEVPVATQCDELIEVSRRILNASMRVDLSTADILDIMSGVRKAAAAGDPNSINPLETELRRVTGRTINASETLGLAKEDLTRAAEACKNGSE